MPYQVGPAEIPGADRAFAVKANVDITQYAAVIQSDSGNEGEVMMPGTAGVAGWGFAQEACDYSEGQHHISVRTLGFSKAVAYDGNISAGDWLSIADTAGRVKTAGNAEYVVARATEASGAQDDLIVVQVVPATYKTPAS